MEKAPKTTSVQVVWILPLLGAIGGGLFFLAAFTANGAPQQAAAAGMACAVAIIPYVLARAVTEIWKESASKKDDSS